MLSVGIEEIRRQCQQTLNMCNFRKIRGEKSFIIQTVWRVEGLTEERRLGIRVKNEIKIETSINLESLSLIPAPTARIVPQ
ncbi:unnamed protein product [Citrullus colocynthis]|uniref:Uncharacterized protein n=1 Tax=Citrullus colocynthis TaxID=252529 RepID=A0ABP0YDT1_9ROSI